MPVSFARMHPLALSPVRVGYCCGLTAFLILIGSDSLQNATANGDTRTISFHHVHTHEDLTITYKKNGRYDDEALKRLNWALRDWRTDEPTKMDPHLIDLLWEVRREVGAKEPVHVIGGYRAPATNALLRRRSSGVARHSLHMSGKAMDFFIPGVPLEELRYAGLRLQRGGVGFYPSSGSPFVHLDTGNVRHWPRLPEAQLARIMSTARKVQVAAATAGDDRTAGAIGSPQTPNIFVKLLGIGRDEEEHNEISVASVRNRATAAAPGPDHSRRTVVAALDLNARKTAAIPLPPSKPAMRQTSYAIASAIARPARPRPAQTASLVARTNLSANEIINERGYWRGLPEADDAPQMSATRRPSSTTVARADPITTASLAPWPMPERDRRAATGSALAYAAPVEPVIAPRPTPMGSGATRGTSAVTAPPDTTVALKRRGDRSSVVSHAPAPTAAADPSTERPHERFSNPWMRAMIIAPSAQQFMSTSLLGAPDFRNLQPYLRKPASSVMMTFSADPHLGMTGHTFSGSAVVFVATVTFNARTALLQQH